MRNDGLDFSFSGLKTSVMNHVRANPDADTADVAASFQAAVVDVLVHKARRAAAEVGAKGLALGGGVAANSKLREDLLDACSADGLHGFLPSRAMCTDNAAMIAAAGWHRLRLDGPTPLDTGAYPNLRLTIVRPRLDAGSGRRRRSRSVASAHRWSCGSGTSCPRAPVVLAPMAGVTNAPFRALCRRFGPGLVYVNEMVMATALVHGNAKTERMMTFDPDEHPRSLQVYGSDPVMMGRAVDRVCDRGLVDHIDLNFGCPAAKVTRKGGGAAVPAKPSLLRAIVRAAVDRRRARTACRSRPSSASACTTGCSPTCGPARSAPTRASWPSPCTPAPSQQHYAGDARWDAIAELKAHVTSIPVLGNGDIWEAADAVAMMRATGCDGVVVGRGCLGRPWLFGDLLEVLAGRPAPPSRPLGVAHGGDGRPRPRRSSPTTATSALAHAGVPQARLVVPHRLPGRRRVPAAASPRSPRWPSSRTSSPRSIRR